MKNNYIIVIAKTRTEAWEKAKAKGYEIPSFVFWARNKEHAEEMKKVYSLEILNEQD